MHYHFVQMTSSQVFSIDYKSLMRHNCDLWAATQIRKRSHKSLKLSHQLLCWYEKALQNALNSSLCYKHTIYNLMFYLSHHLLLFVFLRQHLRVNNITEYAKRVGLFWLTCIYSIFISINTQLIAMHRYTRIKYLNKYTHKYIVR